MTPFVSDPDLTIYVGDALEVLGTVETGSVDCCVTSPPYWGLRDYGTGEWDGGDPECDHALRTTLTAEKQMASSTLGGAKDTQAHQKEGYKDVCGRCGATRVDLQLGLEATPDAYVANMVAVFREVHRVLADHGTCWINLGDSYASGGGLGAQGENGQMADRGVVKARRLGRNDAGRNFTGGGGNREGSGNPGQQGFVSVTHGLKPKDLVGIPWRVAFALQADGWYLRSDIVWAKPNPMPESVTDRPTKAHEYVFLLSKSPRYWFDQEAVREPQSTPHDAMRPVYGPGDGWVSGPQAARRNGGDNVLGNPAGRNVRSVWQIATQPYAEAHFATYPEELVRRCLLAGCPEWVCGTCGKPRERIVDVDTTLAESRRGTDAYQSGGVAKGATWAGTTPGVRKAVHTLGWSDCGHADFRPGVVLDPFLGSGTTALVARNHGRRCVGIELNPDYAVLAARRLQQLSLLA